MTTKIFCDIAELDLIKKFNKKKIVKGFTTNPSLMRKAGAYSIVHGTDRSGERVADFLLYTSSALG